MGKAEELPAEPSDIPAVDVNELHMQAQREAAGQQRLIDVLKNDEGKAERYAEPAQNVFDALEGRRHYYAQASKHERRTVYDQTAKELIDAVLSLKHDFAGRVNRGDQVFAAFTARMDDLERRHERLKLDCQGLEHRTNERLDALAPSDLQTLSNRIAQLEDGVSRLRQTVARMLANDATRTYTTRT